MQVSWQGTVQGQTGCKSERSGTCNHCELFCVESVRQDADLCCHILAPSRIRHHDVADFSIEWY